MSMSDQCGNQNAMVLFEAEDEDDGKDLLQSSVADFDSNSVTGKMDSNDMFGNSKSDFLFGGSRSGQDILLHESRGSVSFNNSISEGDFGSFDCDPIVNKGSFSESGEFVMNNVLASSEHTSESDQDFSELDDRSRPNQPFTPKAQLQVQPTLVEHIRPCSTDQYQDINYPSIVQNPEARPFSIENQMIQDTEQHSFQTQHQSFQHRDEPMGAFEQRKIADVSVEDVRQRQLQFGSQTLSTPLRHLLVQNQEEIHSFAMGQQQGDEFNEMVSHQIVFNGGQQSQLDFDFQQQLSSMPLSAQPHLVGLSNTVHGNNYQRLDGPQTSLHMQNRLAAFQGFVHNVPDAMYAGQMVPSNPAIQNIQGNVSIVAERQSPKTLFNGFDGNGSSASLGQGKNVADAMSEAMEKLSDSMRRTAMSRSMVKQFSSRGLLGKQGSLRMMAKQRSVRALPSQLSDRNLMGEHGSSSHQNRSSMRRSSGAVKHQLQHPARSRSVRQLDAQQTLNQSSHSITLNIDGRCMGEL